MQTHERAVTLHDVVLLGTLPRDVLDALAQHTLTCALHGVTWRHDGSDVVTQSSEAYLTLTRPHNNNNNNNNDEEVQRWTVALQPPRHDVARSVCVQRPHADDTRSSSNDDGSVAAATLPCLLLDAASWTRTRVCAAATMTTTTTTTTTATTPPMQSSSSSAHATHAEDAATHDAPSQAHEAPQSPSVSTTQATAAATTATAAAATTSTLRGRSLPQLLQHDRALLCCVAQYLAPAPRTRADVVAHVLRTPPPHAHAHATRYTVADVAYVVRLLSRTTARGLCELHGAGYALIDIEAYDSKRTKQLVANRAFTELAGRANAQALLRRMELYADRDVLLAARTGGGGIMAGLAAAAATTAAAHTRHTPPPPRAHDDDSDDDDEAQQQQPHAHAHDDVHARKRRAHDTLAHTATDDNNDDNDDEQPPSSLHAAASRLPTLHAQQTSADTTTTTTAVATTTTVTATPTRARARDMPPRGAAWHDDDDVTMHTPLLQRAAAALCAALDVNVDAQSSDSGNVEHVVQAAVAAAAAAVASSTTLQPMPITTAAALHKARATYAALLPLQRQLHAVLQRHDDATAQTRPLCNAPLVHDAATSSTQQQQQQQSSSGTARMTVVLALEHALYTTLYTLARDMSDYVNLHDYGVI